MGVQGKRSGRCLSRKMCTTLAEDLHVADHNHLHPKFQESQCHLPPLRLFPLPFSLSEKGSHKELSLAQNSLCRLGWPKRDLLASALHVCNVCVHVCVQCL